MRCDLHCPRLPGSGRVVAGVIAAAVVVAAVHAVIGAIVWSLAAAACALVAGGLIGLRLALRHAGGRMTSRAEALSAAQAVRAVPASRAAIAARARPVRGELAAPAVRLVEVRPAAQDGRSKRLISGGAAGKPSSGLITRTQGGTDEAQQG